MITTLTLFELCHANASFVSRTVAFEHPVFEPPLQLSPSVASSPAVAVLFRRHVRAMPHAPSLLTTSHSPSLARSRHSSPSFLSVTSGFDIHEVHGTSSSNYTTMQHNHPKSLGRCRLTP
ncbi:unnamed protein product [Musa acuminata subsp. malaccensis]|uniref:(wild Malaysian banana) hypothetical protein n=1 Tax=Musa acuminata subsp. malaccensis TaxID=214687 RepID=A0A804KRQ2_MUSAM|nr:unnamed protein product [Musa acuminata subsp. malaccensis]